MSLPVSDTDFSVFWQPLSEKILTNDLVLRTVKALPFIHQPDRVARKVNDVSAADWRYQTREKNTIFFHVCCYGFSQGQKSFYNTVVYMIISFHAAMNPLSLRTDNKYYDSSNIFARAQLVSTHHETEYPQSNWVIFENIRYDKIGQKGISGSAVIWDFHQI